MSSPPKEKAETRAGHPPAVKAGGMRIVQKHPHNSDAKEEKDKDDQDWETSSLPEDCEPNIMPDFYDVDICLSNIPWVKAKLQGPVDPRKNLPNQLADLKVSWEKQYVCRTSLQPIPLSPPKPAVFISGVIARGDKDFPPAAAQVAHQKPHPSVEKLPHPQHVKQHIHQPRK